MKIVCKSLIGKIREIQDLIDKTQFKMDNWDFEFAGELTFFETDLHNLKNLLKEYQNFRV